MKKGEHQISAAASTLGSVRSAKKSAASRRNGTLGGRPAMKPLCVAALALYHDWLNTEIQNLFKAECARFELKKNSRL